MVRSDISIPALPTTLDEQNVIIIFDYINIVSYGMPWYGGILNIILKVNLENNNLTFEYGSKK